MGTDRDLVRDEALRLLEDDAAYLSMANAVNPYAQAALRSAGAAAAIGALVSASSSPEFVGPE